MPSFHHRLRRLADNNEPRSLSPLFRLWVLRMLVLCGGQAHFVQSTGFLDDMVAEVLGISHLATGDDEFSPSAVRAMLRKQLVEAEKEAQRPAIPVQLARNAERLARLVGLDDSSHRVLAFAVLVKSDPVLNAASNLMGSMSLLRTVQTVSTVLGMAEDSVKESLAADGALARSGLLRIERNSSYQLESKFTLLSDSFAEAMQHEDGDPLALLAQSVRAASAPTLAPEDYRHLGDAYLMLETYVQQALTKRRGGVNILLWGPPGTGKTDLARLIATQVGTTLIEVVCADGDGDPIDGERRLTAYRVAQWIFARKPTLIQFDEIEDVFNDASHFAGRRSFGQTRKGWINSMLEQNPVPALWLTNSVSCSDPAFIRRFDLVIEVPVPPRAQRKAILARACEGLLDDATMSRLAQVDHVPPAVIARAAAVTRVISAQNPALAASAVMEQVIDGTLKAQDNAPVKRTHAGQLPDLYDPAFVNATTDLPGLADGLKASDSGRICLYGPPGTRKTAYGRWLAERLEKPLIIKRGSDLLSMYVGGTEKTIAEALAQARDEQAVLIIDEVDGFLQDRRAAQRSWELTQVNEFLTQMEIYDGIFVASTNLMDGMDQAALRRFDVKAPVRLSLGRTGLGSAHPLLRREQDPGAVWDTRHIAPPAGGAHPRRLRRRCPSPPLPEVRYGRRLDRGPRGGMRLQADGASPHRLQLTAG
jgi:SpoVK/Ycf46/Vps4 family AAA+-type ATPase